MSLHIACRRSGAGLERRLVRPPERLKLGFSLDWFIHEPRGWLQGMAIHNIVFQSYSLSVRLLSSNNNGKLQESSLLIGAYIKTLSRHQNEKLHTQLGHRQRD